MTSQGPSLLVECITARHHFDELREPWERLLADLGEDCPFISHDYAACCLAGAPERKLAVLVVREADRIFGVAPLWRDRVTWGGRSIRRLAFITSPDTGATDLIIAPDHRTRAVNALVEHLLGPRMPAWDLAVLSQWPPESGNLTAFLDAVRSLDGRVLIDTSSATPFIPIEGSWEGFLGTRSYLFRKSRRGILNRIARHGNAQVECATDEDPDELLRQLLSISERGWKYGAGVSMANRPETRRFFEALTRSAQRRGWLMAWRLRLDGVPVAMEYHLAAGGCVYALRADFDEGLRNLSPGAYLEYFILKHLFDEGYRRYEIGPGLDEYKLRWADQSRVNHRVRIYPRTILGHALWWKDAGLIPAMRAVKRFLAVGTRRGPAATGQRSGDPDS